MKCYDKRQRIEKAILDLDIASNTTQRGIFPTTQLELDSLIFLCAVFGVSLLHMPRVYTF
jgi:hypothetical protein